MAHNHYSELHALVDRLAPERTADARRALLRLVAANPHLDEEAATQSAVWAGPSFIGAFDSGHDDLSERVDETLFDSDGPGSNTRLSFGAPVLCTPRSTAGTSITRRTPP